MSRPKNLTLTAAMLALVLPATPAAAIDVTLTGVVVNVCSMTTSPGSIGAEGDGVTLSSDGLGGVPATLNVVATGGVPSLTFSAPTVTTPAGFSGSATPSIAYSSGGGVLQAFTTSTSTRALSSLIDTVSVRGRIVSSAGFASGTYTIRTTVTCQQ